MTQILSILINGVQGRNKLPPSLKLRRDKAGMTKIEEMCYI